MYAVIMPSVLLCRIFMYNSRMSSYKLATSTFYEIRLVFHSFVLLCMNGWWMDENHFEKKVQHINNCSVQKSYTLSKGVKGSLV